MNKCKEKDQTVSSVALHTDGWKNNYHCEYEKKTVFWQFCYFFFLSAKSFRVPLAPPFIVDAHMICIYLSLLMYDARNCLSFAKKNMTSQIVRYHHFNIKQCTHSLWKCAACKKRCVFLMNIEQADTSSIVFFLLSAIFHPCRPHDDNPKFVYHNISLKSGYDRQKKSRATVVQTGKWFCHCFASVAHFRTSAERLLLLGACRKIVYVKWLANQCNANPFSMRLLHTFHFSSAAPIKYVDDEHSRSPIWQLNSFAFDFGFMQIIVKYLCEQ